MTEPSVQRLINSPRLCAISFHCHANVYYRAISSRRLNAPLIERESKSLCPGYFYERLVILVRPRGSSPTFVPVSPRARARARAHGVSSLQGRASARVAAFVAENWRIRRHGTMRDCISYSARSRSLLRARAIGRLSRPCFFPAASAPLHHPSSPVCYRSPSIPQNGPRHAPPTCRAGKKNEKRAFHTRGVNNDDNWSWILPSRLARAAFQPRNMRGL